MEVQWIKITTNIFDNRKIRQIEALPDGDTIIVIWMKLLCLAGTVNDCGFVYFTKDIPYTEQMLASQFNRPIASVQMALKIFEQFGMIEITNNLLCVSNWEKYQNIEGLEKIRELTRIRVAKHREAKRICNVTSNVTVTQGNAIEKNKNKNRKEEDKDIICDVDFSTLKEMENFAKELESKPTKKAKFIPPTLQQVEAYAEARNRLDIAKKFFDYYSVGDWKDAKGNPIKNWKQKFITWEGRNEAPKKERTIEEMNGDAPDINNLRKQLFE